MRYLLFLYHQSKHIYFQKTVIRIEVLSEINKKKNISSKDQIEKDIKLFNEEVEKYKKEKNQRLNEFKKNKDDKLQSFLKDINPLIQDYMKKNSIDLILEENPEGRIVISSPFLKTPPSILPAYPL